MILRPELVNSIRTTSVANTSSLKAERFLDFWKCFDFDDKIDQIFQIFKFIQRRNKSQSPGAFGLETLLLIYTFIEREGFVGETWSLTFHHFLDDSGSFSLVTGTLDGPTSFRVTRCNLYLSRFCKKKERKKHYREGNNWCCWKCVWAQAKSLFRGLHS